jgi:hypothetical protein
VSSTGGHRVVWGLTLIVVVLLAAGVVAVTTVDRPPSVQTKVGAAGLGLQGLDEAREVTTSTTVAAPAPTTPAAPSTLPRPVATTRPAAPTTATTKRAARPPAASTTTGTPPPPAPSAQRLAPGSSWSSSREGIALRVAMEPIAPLAGQEVRFVIDVSSSTEQCCAMGFSFGDGADISPVGQVDCEPPTDQHGIVVTHTYAAAASYQIYVMATSVPCTLSAVDGVPVMPPLSSAYILGCAGVGPGSAALTGCPTQAAYGIDALAPR